MDDVTLTLILVLVVAVVVGTVIVVVIVDELITGGAVLMSPLVPLIELHQIWPS
jgi:hypothetical protein